MGRTDATGAGGSSLAGDLFSVAPGWLVCLAVDPTSAALVAFPIAGLGVIARRRLWPRAAVRGRIAVGALFPFVALSAAASIGLGSAGAIAPWLLSFAALAAVRPARRSPIAAALCLAALAAIFAALLLENGAFRYPTEGFIKAFAAPPPPPVWGEGAKREAIAIAREAAMGKALPRLSGRVDLAVAEAPHGVYVTLYDPAGHTARGFSRGAKTAADDVAAAAGLARDEIPRGSRARGAELRVQIDVPGKRRAATARPLFAWFGEAFRGIDPALRDLAHLGLWLDLSAQSEIGVDGFAFCARGRAEPLVILPGDPITEGTLTPRVTSDPAALAAIAARASKKVLGDPRRLASELEAVEIFRTTSFASPHPGEVVDLYRGNSLLPAHLDRAALVARTSAAVSWLSRQVEASGRFHYEVLPPYRARTDGYSLPRHSGAVYGLLAVYRAGTREPGLAAAGREALPAALAALDYIDRNLAAPEGAPAELLCFLDERGVAESGSTALGAIAIAELPVAADVPDAALASRIRAYPAARRLEGMTRCLLAMIDPDGAVFTAYREARRSRSVAREPLYYPGEVALALATIHEATGSRAALEGALRIADRQRRLYRVPSLLDFPLPGDHWMIQALARLSAATGEPAYAELALLMARGYLREQYPPQALLYPDYRGSYRRVFDVPRTTRAASRGEALGGALKAADLVGADATPYERALLDGARHLAEQQFTAANSYFVPSSMDVLGGIRMGLVDNQLRIDNNQHGLVAMLNAIRAYDRLAARGGS
jgi:hypothetical protein